MGDSKFFDTWKTEHTAARIYWRYRNPQHTVARLSDWLIIS